MPVDVQELIMWHELLHIEPTMNKKGDIKFQIRDHNVKDFRCIIEAKGIDWVEDIYKGVTSTLGENENVNLESIKW
jgi:hypothetical protein